MVLQATPQAPQLVASFWRSTQEVPHSVPAQPLLEPELAAPLEDAPPELEPEEVLPVELVLAVPAEALPEVVIPLETAPVLGPVVLPEVAELLEPVDPDATPLDDAPTVEEVADAVRDVAVDVAAPLLEPRTDIVLAPLLAVLPLPAEEPLLALDVALGRPLPQAASARPSQTANQSVDRARM